MYQDSLEHHKLLQYLNPLIPQRINVCSLRDSITPVEIHTVYQKRRTLCL